MINLKSASEKKNVFPFKEIKASKNGKNQINSGFSIGIVRFNLVENSMELAHCETLKKKVRTNTNRPV